MYEIILKKCQEKDMRYVNYELAFAKSICQWLNSNYMGICHLPVLLQLLTFNIFWRAFKVESEAICGSGKLLKQVFR